MLNLSSLNYKRDRGNPVITEQRFTVIPALNASLISSLS